MPLVEDGPEPGMREGFTSLQLDLHWDAAGVGHIEDVEGSTHFDESLAASAGVHAAERAVQVAVAGQ